MSNCNCTADFTVFPTEMVQGDTVNWQITFKDATDQPMDITGWDLYLILRDTLDAASVTFQRVVKSTMVDGTSGVGVLSIASTDSAAIPTGKYYYEFKRVLPGLTPPDVWTFKSSTKPDFHVKDGVILFS
jgi:hypothetical protein